MPKAYVIVTEAITDPEGMAAYSRAAAPSLAASGARVLAVDTQVQTLEGQWHGSKTVLMEFDSPEAAKAWYESDSYTAARPLRQAAADSHAAIITGL
ncbi:DUF1330 domain-containing protein [Nocardia aurantia]|uniref:DUF1330 domain-containing protein n=1 Tax=Nocardia aurantia TaxID=2585199 RepID=A0A7K0DJJ0_9NOCA|nr:DUF1330 domain-containing protein [Nocardia aurantia]MQY25975.1 hypothetical protein [Nocardia aurantia]